MSIMTTLATDDPHVIVIRGHAYVEAMLKEILARLLRNPEDFNIQRMGFRQALRLADGFGVLEAASVRALSALADLRNTLAHSITAQMTKKLEDDFVNVVRQHPNLAQALTHAEPGAWGRTRVAVAALFVLLTLAFIRLGSEMPGVREMRARMALPFEAQNFDAACWS
ncbi:MAG TPA: hypothetical protein VGO62_05800 [Myxococcota bacterium]|jgi:hypothetical protein